MTYEEIRTQIKTGDLAMVAGDSFVSAVIEAFTGPLSHVGVFVILNGGLFIAEEWEGVGFQIVPASQRIPQYGGKVYWGKAPDLVRNYPQGIMEEVATYRRTPSLQPYGYGTLLKVLWAHQTGDTISPDEVQAVCSVFAQQTWERCGFKFKTLADPSDFLQWVTGKELINV